MTLDLARVPRDYDREQRAGIRMDDPRIRVEWDGPVLRIVGAGSSADENAVIFSRLDGTTAEAAIRRQVDFFESGGKSFEWKLHDYDPPAQIAELLVAAGFEARDVETLVVLDASRGVPAGERTSGITFERLQEPESYLHICALSEAVYGDAEHARWIADNLSAEERARPGSTAVHVARANDVVVSAGWTRFDERGSFASLWGGATLPRYRRRGIYRALVERRVAEARERDFRYLTVDCSADSLPILERLGFERLAVITPYVWSSPTSGRP